MTGYPICGATTKLGPDGACLWRAGCEHRAMQAEARSARAKADDDGFLALLDAEAAFWMDPLPCGHTAAEHAGAIRSTGTLTDAAEWGNIIGTLWTGDPSDPSSRPVGSAPFGADGSLYWRDAPEVDGSRYSRADWPDDEQPPSDWS
jgi:hypothetical protein